MTRRRIRPGPAAGPAPQPEPAQPGRLLDARLHLLDRLVLDRSGEPVTTVADAEVEVDPAGLPRLTGLLAGPVLGTRIFGGTPPRSRWERIAWRDVTDVGTTVRLARESDELTVTWTERWVRDRIIARIPGGRHDPE
ncbi:hypothetical protein [Cellulomonas denverensis]|uniref:Uncharacterized protein n=1 Tax=Cellulomonas denverensis TaxID=264297 RepID=A0A7X6KUL9_9CELL|nr:hypothetical protein [Cellulomonas denverensis]NKY22458.1 hypothetical protein [Cellulomonas denverensis]GIG25931.1 hypothetical protein Cde04nite_21750 [Cellulomonas denverensis]